MPIFHDAKMGAAITVKVVPRASKTEIADVMDDGTLRIRVAAPPVEGAANAALIEFLAERLGLPASQIDIVAGMTSERKLISLVGISPDQVEEKLKPPPSPTGRKPRAARPLKKTAVSKARSNSKPKTKAKTAAKKKKKKR